MTATPTGTAPPSIRQRLIRAVVSASVAWMLLMSVTVITVIQHQVDALADAGLQESAELLFGVMTTTWTPTDTAPNQETLPAPPHTENVTWQRVSAAGRLQLRSHQAPGIPFFNHATPGLSDAPGDWRVYGLELPQDHSMLYMADHQSERRRTRLRASWAVVGITLVIGSLFVFWLQNLIRQELRPLLVLSRAVATHDPARSPLELPSVNRQELLPIQKAILDLSRRLTLRMENERAFSAHAAHALRTPLAGIDAQLAVAMRECTPEVYPRLKQTREAANRLKRVVSSLLTLFRTSMDIQWRAIKLATLVGAVSIDQLDIQVIEPALVEADPDLLAAALINLLDNVARHGGHRVSIRVLVNAEFQIITLSDDGPGIPEARLHELHLALALQDYQGHMGLGLMLADMVARAHGGSLQITNLGTGLSAEMILQRKPLA
jgi:two-component system OmpR family sensor kinase